MLKSIITIFTVLFALTINAQRMNETVSISFGDLKMESGGDVIIVSTFKVDDGYIVLKKQPIRGPGGFNYYLEKFNEELKSQKTHDITAQFEDDNFVINGIIKVKEAYILFSTKDFPDVREEALYGQTFNWDSGEISKPNKIFTQEYEKRRGGIDYEMKTSSDDNLLLLTINPPYKKDQKESVTFEVYDHELERLYAEENITFEEKDKNYSIKETLLGSDGKIYLLGVKYTPRDRKLGREQGPIEYEIITINDGIQDKSSLDFGDKFVDDISLVFSEDDILYCGGYYRKEDGIGIDGVFLFDINKETGEVENEIWDEFTKEFITEGWSDRAVAKAKKKEDRKGTDLGLTNLEFRSVIKHDDGSISMVGEIFWITTSTRTNSNGTTTTTTTYHYGDLVVSRVNKEGEFSNHARFDKHHTYYGAYEYFNLENEVAVLTMKRRTSLYDYDMESLTKIQKKEMAGVALVLATIKEDGTILEEGIMDFNNPDYAGYRKYNRIRNEAFVLDTDNGVEVLITTYFGKKKFGICKLDFTKN